MHSTAKTRPNICWQHRMHYASIDIKADESLWRTSRVAPFQKLSISPVKTRGTEIKITCACRLCGRYQVSVCGAWEADYPFCVSPAGSSQSAEYLIQARTLSGLSVVTRRLALPCHKTESAFRHERKEVVYAPNKQRNHENAGRKGGRRIAPKCWNFNQLSRVLCIPRLNEAAAELLGSYLAANPKRVVCGKFLRGAEFILEARCQEALRLLVGEA